MLPNQGLRYQLGPYPQFSLPLCSRRGPDAFFEGSEHRPGKGNFSINYLCQIY